MLPRSSARWPSSVLVATGDVVLAFKDGTAFDAVSGQEWVFEIARFQREVERLPHPAQSRARAARSRPTSRPATGLPDPAVLAGVALLRTASPAPTPPEPFELQREELACARSRS